MTTKTTAAGADLHRSHFTNDLNQSLVGHKVKIAGWVEDIRDIGKLAFLIIRDSSGAAQAIVTGENLDLARNTPRQSAVIISGLVQNTKAKDFQVELKVEELKVLTKAVQPLPIDPTGRVESALDKRLDCRALDLRNPKISAIFLLRSEALYNIRETLRSKGFVEVTTPKIIGSASEGGANLFSLAYFKTKAYLAQSPQLYKEQLSLALDKVFEIGPYFRAENSHTVRHLSEFTSIDIEAAFMDYEDVMDIVEELLRNLFSGLLKNCKEEIKTLGVTTISSLPERRIDRLTYEQCLEELAQEDEKIEFGNDLSDASLRKLGEKHQGFYPVNFVEHLKAFDWGMPPHSGWGLGFDRLMMVITNSQNVRDVVLYPRDTERITP